jgi:hypothetical protein
MKSIDVDIKEGEVDYDIVSFIKSIINPKYLKFIKTNGGFHCLVSLKTEVCGFMGGSEYEFYEADSAKQADFSEHKNWYQQLQNHPFKSELNIMSNDLIPIVGCNQGKFVPFMFQ